MRVVANVPRAHFTGGVELSVFYTLRGLSERGHEVHLLYGEGGDLVARYKDFCKSVTHIEPWDFFFPAGRLAGLREHARVLPAAAKAARRRPDVYYMNRSFAAVWALDAAMVAPAPVVCHWRGPMTPPARYLPRLAKRVSRFLANSDFTRQGWLKVGIDPAKTAVVYPGIDPDKHPFGGQPEREAARQLLGVDQDAFVTVYVGRLDPEKGVEVLFDAWGRLGAGPGEAELLVVGEVVTTAEREAVLARLQAMAPKGSVRFLGTPPDTVPALHAADVAVVPSVYEEPFGRTVIEGLATGRPVIASRTGGIPEILAGPLDRFLFEKGDAQALADQLRAAMGWQQREPELAPLCRARVTDNFTLKRMVDGVETNLVRAVG